ncbi:MAG: hypothetical protein IKT32_02110, partial [Clostridia bacterium]|nr:hypothetical protein [Clostridia bacterium]
AVGKDQFHNEKLTDILYELIEFRNAFDFDKRFLKFINRVSEFCDDLNIPTAKIIDFNQLFMQFRGNFSTDYLVSRGEYYTTKACALFLNSEFLPAEEIITFDKYGKINEYAFIKLKQKINETNKNYLIPGFYGVDYNGNIKLFERGGSDISGAIVAKMLNATLYENYSDVNGILNTHLKNSDFAKTISSLSYGQLSSISSQGLQVFQEKAIPYLFRSKLKTKLANTFNSNGSFTLIDKKSNFVFYKKPSTFYKISNIKKYSKSRFIIDIFNVFMFNKINIINPVYINNSIFFQVKKEPKIINFKLIQHTKIYIFGKKYFCKIPKLIRYLTEQNLDFSVNREFKKFDRIAVNLFGDQLDNHLRVIAKIFDNNENNG